MHHFAEKKVSKVSPSMSNATAVQQGVSGELIRGVGFVLAGIELIIPIDQVQEIVSCESVTPVPLTKHWLAGVTSIRSEAYTICDLDAFISGVSSEHVHKPNVIVLRAAEMRCALKVNRIIGLRQFCVVDDGVEAETVDAPSTLKPYLDGVVEVSSKKWRRFNVARLLTNPEFIHAQLDEQTESDLAG